MGYQNVETFRQYLLSSFEKFQTDRLTDRQFSELVEDIFTLDEDIIDLIQRDTPEIFHTLLDPAGRGFLTRDDIKALSQETLKTIVRHCEEPHGPVAGAPGDKGAASKLKTLTEAEQDKHIERGKEKRDEL